MDLRVSVAAVQEATAPVLAAADRCQPPQPVLTDVQEALPGSALAAAAAELDDWAAAVQEQCALVSRHARLARESAQALVAVDAELATGSGR